MATPTTAGAESTGQGGTPPPRWPRWTFRITSSIAAVLLFDQAVIAGQLLNGSYHALASHEDNAGYASAGVGAALVAAVLLRWPGRGPVWPLLATAGILLLVGLQIGLGYARLLSLHVPVGVAVIMLAIALAAWSWRRA